MSTRLQVVVDEAELAEIRAAAERHRLNVSEWVRRVLRAERDRERRGVPVHPLPTFDPAASVAATSPSRVTERQEAYGAGGPAPRVRVDLDVRADLLDAVRQRYRTPDPRAAIELALRRAAVRPMSKEEALGMEGAGWDGHLDAIRSADPGALW